MIYLGTDHAGFELKEEIKKYLLEFACLPAGRGLEVEDLGAFSLNPDDDYPDFIIPVAKKVSEDSESKGIVFGGSGEGEAIAANKIKGIRAAVYYGGPLDIVKLSCQHNDTNILSIGARFVSKEQAKEAVKLWLETKFEGGRHERRIEEIKELEQ